MEFTEFLIKKKIDRALFCEAEPALFLEFQQEYAAMGPKSFDHTKKFWFNKLRRAYHLVEIVKPKTTIEQTDPISQATTLDSPTIEQKPAYVPRFKAQAVTGQPEHTKQQEITPSDPGQAEEPAVVPPKTGYVPRFKAKPKDQ